MRRYFSYIIFFILLWGCNHSQKNRNPSNERPKATAQNKHETGNSYAEILPSVVKIQTYDNGRILESAQGFFVGEDIIATRLSMMTDANQATFSGINEKQKHKIAGFLAIDRINDLVLLKTDDTKREPIPLFQGIAPDNSKTIYLTKATGNTIPLHKGKLLCYSKINGSMAYTISNKFHSPSFGTPIFVSKQAIGLAFSKVVDYEMRYFAIPSNVVSELMKQKKQKSSPIENINQVDKAVANANSKIKGLVIETDLGNIKIRLLNETPAYRDNFIKLVREHYYDSLLIHRVIKGFCIQSGAADTRYAEKDDVVGWKGPGYSLPAHIVTGLYHKRGMIGSPRKPDTKNAKRRSDGSQFYIVTGRIYSDSELDEIEQQNHIKFTANQRKTYKTIGGAPHIDGTYTIFGEVLSGMDIADKISKQEVGKDFRPKKDIRVKRIRIMK